VLVSSLGIAQIISWGTLFYSIGVLGPAMRAELGATELFLFSAFTAGLLISGTAAPLAGRTVDRRGGRFVLSIGSTLGAVAMAIVAVSTHPWLLAAGWLVAGCAMAACLYDPAFATLSQHTGERYRRSVTALTLFGGFASTVFWPVSQFLLDTVGWRQAYAVFAALHLFVCLPIHRWIVPPRPAEPASSGASATGAVDAPKRDEKRIRLFSASLALVSFIVGTLAIHVISLLTAAGLTAQQAVSVAMLFGPMQVAGRIVEMSLSRRISAVIAGYASFALITVALVALAWVQGFGIMAFVFVIAYGAGNGVQTIVRGTAPAELFGREGLGAILGRIGSASQIARAVAPACFTAVITLGLTRNEALAGLVGISIAAVGCFAAAVRGRAAAR
jgi:predicted MFS family arabinose efflux permease